MFRKILPIILATLIVVSMATAIVMPEFRYSPNVKPHTRYNPLRAGCFYYYGYGSCEVEAEHCRGVPVGRNKWIDLGDACDRNDPPILTGAEDITVTETETVIISAECTDEDPVEISYSGWTEQAETITTYDDAGEYQITITCTDSFEETDTATIKVTVKDKNRAPLFRAFGYSIE